jgi:hypothetical protein
MVAPLRTTDDVVDYLGDVAARADRGSLPEASGIFARAYQRVTLEMIQRIAAGVFEDPAWLAAFDVKFANSYRVALEDPQAAAGPWRLAFAKAKGSRGVVLKHLLLGINAHMSYDLCVVLVDGLVDDRARRKRDFDAVNRVMHLAISPIQSVVEDRYGEWLRRADTVGLGVDELLTYDRFVRWRTRAWDDAMAILDGRATVAEVDDRVTRRGRLIAWVPL